MLGTDLVKKALESIEKGEIRAVPQQRKGALYLNTAMNKKVMQSVQKKIKSGIIRDFIIKLV